MNACAAVPQASGFVSSMTSFLDCQAQVLGSGAYQVLAAPGSTLAIVLTGFLTIFIALIGYNLLLGHALTVRSGTLAFVKIGAVFALATSWPAYRTLVYDLVIDGPAQLVGEIGRPTGVVGSDGTLLERLDLADGALARLSILGPGHPSAGANVELPPPPFAGFNAFALGGSRILFLLTAIGGLGVIRVITGLMLALGPFFIAFLMFDSTRSLFEGWVRVLAGAALAAIGVTIALGLQLALLEPWLSGVLARRMAGEPLPTLPTELFVVVTLFSIVVIGPLIGSARIARAFRLPPVLRLLPIANEQGQRPTDVQQPRTGSRSDSAEERSRAAAVASVLAAASRRDGEARLLANGNSSALISRVPDLSRAAGDGVRNPVSIGRSYQRRASARVTASANRRDARE